MTIILCMSALLSYRCSLNSHYCHISNYSPTSLHCHISNYSPTGHYCHISNYIQSYQSLLSHQYNYSLNSHYCHISNYSHTSLHRHICKCSSTSHISVTTVPQVPTITSVTIVLLVTTEVQDTLDYYFQPREHVSSPPYNLTQDLVPQHQLSLHVFMLTFCSLST